MKKLLILGLAAIFANNALSDTLPPSVIQLKGATDGMKIGNVSDALKVSGTFTPSGTTTVVQPTGTNLHAVIDNLPSTQPVSGSLGRTWNLGFSGDKVDASGSAVSVSNFPANQPISAAALPLPSGAATAALQSSIFSALGSPFQAGGSIGNTSFGISGTLPAFASTPTFNLGTIGAASTAANQVTAQASLTSIDSKLTSPLAVTGTFFQATQPVSIAASVQTKAPVNVTGSGSAAGATVSTVTTLTAPANAVGFVLMNLDTSTTNMRWAVGRTASTTLGQQLQPGRDTGFVPAGADISIIAESGTVTYDVQWVSQ